MNCRRNAFCFVVCCVFLDLGLIKWIVGEMRFVSSFVAYFLIWDWIKRIVGEMCFVPFVYFLILDFVCCLFLDFKLGKTNRRRNALGSSFVAYFLIWNWVKRIDVEMRFVSRLLRISWFWILFVAYFLILSFVKRIITRISPKTCFFIRIKGLLFPYFLILDWINEL